MTLLTLVQETANLLSIPPPTTVVGSTDTQVRQLFALSNEEGRANARSYDWQELTKEWVWTTNSGDAQTGAIPADWDRFYANSSYNRTTIRPMLGPITPQQWQAIQAYPQINSVYLSFRVRGNVYLVTPTGENGDTAAYEYVSANWCLAADDTPKPAFTADTDTTVLPEWLFTLGLRWRFRKSKNLDYAEDFRTYQSELQQLQARDGGNGIIDITGRNLYNPLGLPNIPVGNFPG